jgi:hypothetical protein
MGLLFIQKMNESLQAPMNDVSCNISVQDLSNDKLFSLAQHDKSELNLVQIICELQAPTNDVSCMISVEALSYGYLFLHVHHDNLVKFMTELQQAPINNESCMITNLDFYDFHPFFKSLDAKKQ